MPAITVCNNLEPKGRKENLSLFPFFSPSICHEVMGPDAMILVFWMLSFKPAFSLSSFTFIKRFFSSSSFFAFSVVSSAYLGLLIFLLAILIPTCAFSQFYKGKLMQLPFFEKNQKKRIRYIKCSVIAS